MVNSSILGILVSKQAAGTEKTTLLIEEKLMLNLSFPLASANTDRDAECGGGGEGAWSASAR